MRNAFIAIIAAAAVVFGALWAGHIFRPLQTAALYRNLHQHLEANARRAEQARFKQSAVLSQQEVTAVLGPLVKGCPGAVVVGLIDRHRQLVLGWGKDISGAPAGGETRFEVASVSKAFAGLLLAQLVEKGDLQLEEPVEQVANTRIPSFRNQKVTLRQLATHSSGLPPWPDNRGATTSPYSSADLSAYLRQASLMARPDSEVFYSNTGFALLGDALARQKGRSFDDLLQLQICKPLAMTHTTVGLNAVERSQLAIGHWAAKSAAHSSAPTASGAADGIRSTVHDLLKLVGAYIGIQPTDFSAALKLSCKRYMPFDDRLDCGLGWFIDTKDGTVEKSGKIAGYRSHVSFDPVTKVGIVILAGWEAFPSPEAGKTLLTAMIARRKMLDAGGVIP